jgi:hypothetical protein
MVPITTAFRSEIPEQLEVALSQLKQRQKVGLMTALEEK